MKSLLVILYFIAIWIDFFFPFHSVIFIVGKDVGETVLLIVADRVEPVWRVVWCLPSVLKVHSPFVQQPHHWCYAYPGHINVSQDTWAKMLTTGLLQKLRVKVLFIVGWAEHWGHPTDEFYEPLRGLHANENVSEIDN